MSQAEGGSVAELARLRREAAGCHNCPLWEIGKQAVFGAGPVTARVMLIGRRPAPAKISRASPSSAPPVLATIHPSFVLIQPKESHDRWRETLFADVRAIAERARGHESA